MVQGKREKQKYYLGRFTARLHNIDIAHDSSASMDQRGAQTFLQCKQFADVWVDSRDAISFHHGLSTKAQDARKGVLQDCGLEIAYRR